MDNKQRSFGYINKKIEEFSFKLYAVLTMVCAWLEHSQVAYFEIKSKTLNWCDKFGCRMIESC
jgi:hypothetical protein